VRVCVCSTVELVPGGADRRVTFENYTEYVEAATAMRLHEFDSACAAMRRGMVRSMCARMGRRGLPYPMTDVVV
jgi:hypothetical protein